ncbi:hypothetical protein GWI33_011940 [Rhynchophorus ferrugineus]|uniref:Uncharacterized protein n=1 Tax=Rhynchophorus ferrugineus TaxID=354439 RepID=A0A834MN47_RHYFE|nr:hypothetical protein GWI33_011940 [Rhynchophorus ferrugineus]
MFQTKITVNNWNPKRSAKTPGWFFPYKPQFLRTKSTEIQKTLRTGRASLIRTDISVVDLSRAVAGEKGLSALRLSARFFHPDRRTHIVSYLGGSGREEGKKARTGRRK